MDPLSAHLSMPKIVTYLSGDNQTLRTLPLHLYTTSGRSSIRSSGQVQKTIAELGQYLLKAGPGGGASAPLSSNEDHSLRDMMRRRGRGWGCAFGGLEGERRVDFVDITSNEFNISKQKSFSPLPIPVLG